MAHDGQQLQGITFAVRGTNVTVTSRPAKQRTVEQHVAASRATWRQVVEIVRQATRALEHAHQQGHLYGTLESSDIRIGDDGEQVLVEFREERQPPLSSYTAPEQLTFWTVERQTDLYRLGVVLYKLLTGRAPFRATDPDALFEQVRVDDPQPPRQLVHGLPENLDSICLRLLAKKPELRIASAAALEKELRLVLREFDDQAQTSTQSHSKVKGKRSDFIIVDFKAADRATNEPGTHGSDLLVYESEESESEESESEEIRALLKGFHAKAVSWDGDEILFQQAPTTSHDDAIGRVLAIGVGLMDFAHRCAHKSGQTFRIRVESAELDSVSLPNDPSRGRFRSSDLIRRVTRVAGEVTDVGAQVNHSHWQSLRRWVEHTEADEGAMIRTSREGALLPVHVRPAEPPGPTFGPSSSSAIVKARWAQAREGLGQLVLIIGEEGSGKSRLVSEVVQWVEQSEQPEVVVWNCVPRSQDCSFHPLARSLKQRYAMQDTLDDQPQLAQQYLSDIGMDNEESVEFLSSMLETNGAKLGEQARPLSSPQKAGVHNVILKWLGHATKQSPVLFVVEDLQWADPATLDLVSKLASNRLYDHLLLIATFRPEFETLWGSRAHQTQVALRRFTRKHVEKMIRSRFGDGKVDQQMVEHALRVTGGIPLYIDAYLNRLQMRNEK